MPCMAYALPRVPFQRTTFLLNLALAPQPLPPPLLQWITPDTERELAAQMHPSRNSGDRQRIAKGLSPSDPR